MLSPNVKTITRNFTQEVDFAVMVSANTGVELQYHPYEFSNWVNTMMSLIGGVVSNFIPPLVVPLAAMSSKTAYVAMTDPEGFKEENEMGLEDNVRDACVDSATLMAEYMDSVFKRKPKK